MTLGARGRAAAPQGNAARSLGKPGRGSPAGAYPDTSGWAGRQYSAV